MIKKFEIEKEFGEKWVSALESGKYLQGRNFLMTDNNGCNHYCCLGVACHLFNKELSLFDKGFPIEVISKDAVDFPNILLKNYENSLVEMLSKLNDNEVDQYDLERAKLKGFNMIIDENGYIKNGNYTFKDIAKFIRDNVEFV